MRCKVEDHDGTAREVQRAGRSTGTGREGMYAGAEITLDTKMVAIVELCFDDFRAEALPHDTEPLPT